MTNLYKNIIDCKVIESGCYLNNQYKKIKFKKKKIKKLIFISTSDFDIEKRYNISNYHFFSYEIHIINFIFNYCLENDILLYIYPKFTFKRKEFKSELDFFKKNLPSNYFNKKWFIVKKINSKYIYKNITNYDLAISTDSTLGYELLARRFKCIILKARCDYLKKKFNINFSESFRYGWPEKIKKNHGDFWSNKFDEKILNKIFHKVSNLSYKDWNKTLDRERNRLYNHDYKNKKFFKILNQIVNEKK